jgi:hypothetical protein
MDLKTMLLASVCSKINISRDIKAIAAFLRNL